MARKKKELPLLEKVTILDVAAEGKAVAKVNDLVVFVPYVVPGDVVDLQVGTVLPTLWCVWRMQMAMSGIRRANPL